MKAKLYILSLLIIGSVACNLYSVLPVEAGDKDSLMAPKVLMIICSPSFCGSESISINPIFSVTNPNNVLISARLDYSIEMGGKQIGKSQLPKMFIPPNETIEINDAIVVPFKTWFATEALSGKSPQEAVLGIAPLWKGIGGLRPDSIINEATWEKIPVEKASIFGIGSIMLNVNGQHKIFHFTSECQE